MSNIEVTHRIDVSASAESVHRIVADVGLWPLYFPPTVRAERVSGDDTDERIRIWAVANGRLRTWESRRITDGRRVRFEQIRPSAPVAALGGEWSVEERGSGRCAVVLDHHYRAVDDDPVQLDLIARAVEHNSVSELAHLKRAAERGESEKELLLDFEDTEIIAGSLEDTYDFLYDVGKWPERVPHVARIELREDTPGLQHMEMDTISPDGSLHTTVSGRVCDPSRRIVYKQTKLPPVLQAHNGEWTFESTQDGSVRVTSRHQVILDPDGIAALPEPPASLDAAKAAVRHALGSNSRATLARARQFVESR
ncbi:aromatase/cyclase [Streptomyces liangshanensis]|uniref:Cyclase n=1 Tax=Streptomyces liangshanensis TaxID=2717324 RepID=A0A6G9GUF9_9ACTN|nr:aromatase/cyclase [Streptomyces liangshanensis]QIQ01855.1 cyclase [Streptomyces liangshanensis]